MLNKFHINYNNNVTAVHSTPDANSALFNNNSPQVYPGMHLCSSMEATVEHSHHPVDIGFFVNTKLASVEQEYNVVIRSKAVPHVD